MLNVSLFFKRGLCPLFFGVYIVFCFLTPFERDEILYHLAVPKFWLHNGLVDPDFSHFFYYPSLVFFFNYLALLFSLPILSHIFHLSFLIFTVFLVYRNFDNKTLAHYISLTILTLQPALRFSYVAYADFYLLFFVTASILLIKRWYEEGNDFNIYLSAISCGLGLNAKYNMLVVALVLYILVFWLSYLKLRSIRKTIFYTVSYKFISIFFFLPFLLRNYLLTGNPIYPLFNSMFVVRNGFAFENMSHFIFRNYFYNESLWQILLNPIMVFFYGKENTFQYFDGVLNPIFVILPIIVVFLTKRKEYYIYLLCGWFYSYLVLFLEPVQARFLLPSIPFFIIVVGDGLSRFRFSDKKLILLFLPFLLFNLFFGYKHILDKDKWQYILGKITTHEFLSRKNPDYKSIKFINEKTANNSKIFFIFSGQKTYYLQRDFIYDSFNDGRLFKRFMEGVSDERDLSEKLKAERISHLFIRQDLFESYAAENFNEHELDIIKRFFEVSCKIIFSDKYFLVFELKND